MQAYRVVKFGKVRREWTGDQAVDVLYQGAHVLTLTKSYDGTEWYAYGLIDTLPDSFKQNHPEVLALDDDCDYGRTVREAKKYINQLVQDDAS